MKKVILVIGFIISITAASKAAHIIGGDVTYKCILIDSALMRTTYEITMTVYRDSKGGGAVLDNPARFGIFRSRGPSWDFLESREIGLNSTQNITFTDDPCIIIPPNLGVEKGTYVFELTLPWSAETYKISYQRCCRNNTITNLVSPGETGAVFEVNILPAAQTSCNNSPTFDNFPPIIICAGVDLDITQSATDSEGDQLVYEFCAPLAAGGTDGATTPGDPESCTGVMPNPANCGPAFDEVVFNLPTYSATNPMGTASGVTINPTTGVITGRPELIGQYVVGVCVKEFRNGQLIGEIRRDFQFNVAFCEIAVQANIEPDNPKAKLGEVIDKSFEIISCGPTTLNILNLSEDARNIDSYLWEMEIAGSTVSKTTQDAEFNFPGLGTYFGKMILNPGSTSCSDTAFLEVNIFPSINADFEFEYDTCIAGPISYMDLSTTGATSLDSWQWNFDNSGSSMDQNASFQFENPGLLETTLTVTDSNGCIDSITKPINWQPAPEIVVLEPSQFIGCNPADIFFKNLSTPIDETYDILWDFGDGGTSNEISPTHSYTENGFYDVSISIISPIGCEAFRAYPQLIEIKPKPTANYAYSPEEPSVFRKEIDFIDQSIDAVNWSWNFGGIGAAFEPNPTFNFPDTGVYKVDLIVVNNEGCSDTISQLIDIIPLVTLQMPNAFTPNNDGLNDTFKGKGITDGITDYNLQIWNRWGELIFESEFPEIGWNGEIEYNGQLAQQGVYVYTLQYTGPRGDIKSQKGHVTLIR